ncbi:MAG: HAD family hydrolase [Pseudomonadota bacterium]
MSKIRGIFFDLGGTLFRYPPRRSGGGGIGYVMSRFNIEATGEEIGAAWRRASGKAGTHYNAQPYFLHKDLFRASVTHFLNEFGHTPDEDLLQMFHTTQLQGMVDHLPIRDECTRALTALRERGLYLSIVSNIDDDYLDPLIEKHALHDYLDHWTSSEEAKSCKPDAGIYHYCLDKAGLPKEEVLFVGDSLHHDVAGAAAVGMRSARIVEEGVNTPLTDGLEATAEPTYVISSLDELIPIVEQANG